MGHLVSWEVTVGNVISLKDRLERWQFTYTDPGQNFSLFTSDHGRLKLTFSNKQPDVYLEFTESVNFLEITSKAIENALSILYEQN